MGRVNQLAKSLGIGNVQPTCAIEHPSANHVTFLGHLSFKKFLKPNLKLTVLTNKEILSKIKEVKGNTYVVVDNPHARFVEYHNAYHEDFEPLHTGSEKPTVGKDSVIDSSVRCGKNVKIGSGVSIGPNVVLGTNVTIGDGTTIYPNCTIYDNVSIGKNCYIDAGVVIGGEGYSTLIDKKKSNRLKNIGGVQIHDNVEIGCNTVIDRASFAHTIVHSHVKLDNLVYVSHNAEIGEHTRICGSTCMGGSCKIGKRVWIGLGCTIKQHTAIGDDASVLINSVLISNVAAGKEVGGFYSIDHKSWLLHMKDIYTKYVLK